MRKIRCKVDGEMDEISIYENVIDGNLDLSGMDLEELPDLSDVTVTGSFKCANNLLKSLKGAPQHVGRDFDCHGNVLYTLKGAPRKVGRDFDCRDNYLSDLMGAPQHVGGSFDCSHNHSLEWLKGAPQFVGRDFICRGSVPLTPKWKLDLPQEIRGRCDVDVLEMECDDDDVLEMECDDDVLEMECAEMAEKILADFKQKQPELFVSTKKEKTKKDTAENNSMSLAIKTKKKTLGRARQKSKQDTKKRDGAGVSEEECIKMAENILADFKQEHPELFVSTKKEKTKKDTAENNSVSLAIKTKKEILDRARQKSK